MSEGRERVLLQAHTLFLERGFAEVSMQQIADAVAMTKASLYYHFRNKEDLFAHVVQHEARRLFQSIQTELDGVDSFEGQLKRLAHFMLTVHCSDIGRLMSDYKRHVVQGEYCPSLTSDDLNPVWMLRPYFAAAVASGELRPIDVDLAIIAFFSMIDGVESFAEHDPAAIPRGEEVAETLVDLFLHGAQARSPALRP